MESRGFNPREEKSVSSSREVGPSSSDLAAGKPKKGILKKDTGKSKEDTKQGKKVSFSKEVEDEVYNNLSRRIETFL